MRGHFMTLFWNGLPSNKCNPGLISGFKLKCFSALKRHHTWADEMMTNFVKTTSAFMVVPDVLSHWIQLLGSFYRTKKSQSVLIKRTSRNRQPTACTEAPLSIQLQLPKDLLREIKMLTSCSYPQSANNATCRGKNDH